MTSRERWDEAFVVLFVLAGLIGLIAILAGRDPLAVAMLALVGAATVALTVLRVSGGGSLRDWLRGQSTRGACATCHHTDRAATGCQCTAGWCPCHRSAYGHGGWTCGCRNEQP